jgi:actin-related protein
MFKKFSVRLKGALRERVEGRLAKYEEMSGQKPTPIEVKVESSPKQRFAVWYGASQFSNDPSFAGRMHTRDAYYERGPQIARSNLMFDYSAN